MTLSLSRKSSMRTAWASGVTRMKRPQAIPGVTSTAGRSVPLAPVTRPPAEWKVSPDAQLLGRALRHVVVLG